MAPRPPRALHLLPLAVLLVATATLPPGADAWGKEGHIMVCKIAEKYLSAKAAAAVQDLLPASAGGELSTVCPWADQVRWHYHWASPLHYANTPQVCGFKYSMGEFKTNPVEDLADSEELEGALPCQILSRVRRDDIQAEGVGDKSFVADQLMMGNIRGYVVQTEATGIRFSNDCWRMMEGKECWNINRAAHDVTEMDNEMTLKEEKISGDKRKRRECSANMLNASQLKRQEARMQNVKILSEEFRSESSRLEKQDIEGDQKDEANRTKEAREYAVQAEEMSRDKSTETSTKLGR